MGEHKHHEGLPVHGYQPQSEANVAVVNLNKADEERLLRRLDAFEDHARGPDSVIDGRWLAIARNHIEQGFMALNRSVFKPGRVSLPEDKE